MKRNAGKMVAVLLAAVLGILSLAGCANEAGKTDADTVGAAFGSEKIYLDEVKLYVYDSQFEIEESSEAMIGMLYGGYKPFWEENESGTTYWEFNRQTAMSKLYQTKILVTCAGKDGVSLTSDEQAKVDQAVSDFMTKKDAVVKAAGADEALVKKYVTDNALANKYYQKMTEDIDTAVDDAAMKRSHVEGLTVIAKNDFTPEDGEKVEYSEDEQVSAREQAVADAFEKVNGGAEIDDVVDEFTGSETVTVYSLGDLEISAEDAAEEGEEITSYKQRAYTMKTGEVVNAIYNNSNGQPIGYVMRCVNDDDPDMRQKAVDTEIATRKNEEFNRKYAEVQEKYKKFHVYEEYLKAIGLTGALYQSANVPFEPVTTE